MSDKIDSKKVALRLRAVMADLELDTVDELAKLLGAERSQVSNWLNGYNLPPVRWAGALCSKRPGLDLDWLYRGVPDALPVALAIKLEALMQGMAVPLCDRSAKQPKGKAAAPTGARTAKARKAAT